jgi:alpha-galactosidase
MNEKVVLIGAGSAVFTRGLIADLLEMGWSADLALVDTNPEALGVAEKLARKMIAARKAPVTVRAALDRREVLPGATVVITTIGVGGRRGWEQDVFVPRKYGVFQPVGDTAMPGGTSRALRMIPAMVDIARDVADLAPGALFFNYGNPMAVVCRAVRKATGVPMVGLCHGVPHVERFLAKALGLPPAEMTFTAIGMNHLTWFIEAFHQGRDAMPRLREIALEQAKDNAPLPHVTDGPDLWEQMGTARFSWHLMRVFGAFPAVLDRHVVEFFPHFFPGGAYYGRTLGVDAIPFEVVIENGDKGYAEMTREANSDQPLPADYFKRGEGEHEQVLEIIASIRKGDGRTYSANLPNQGQVPNLPLDSVLEAPAIATAAGLRPIAQKPLPSGIAGTLATRLQWVETTVEAALEGSRDKFVQALALDGAVPSLDVAAKLADELLAVHAQYLPQFRRT